MQAAASTIDAEAPALRGAGGARLRAAQFWIRALVTLANRMPRVARLMRPVGVWFAWTCSGPMRRATLANARRILGAGREREARALAKRVVGTFYDFLVEMGGHGGDSPSALLEGIESVEGVEAYFRAREAGKGAIVVTAHIGSFEVGAAAMRKREEHVHVVFQRDPIREFEARRAERHARLGLIETPVDPASGEDTWNVWLRLRDALRADHVVLLQGDRTMPGQRGRKVPFMGGHVNFPQGPVKLAMATGAPIVPVCSPRMPDGRVRVIMEEPIWIEETTERGSATAPHPAELKLAKVIEGWVRRYPEQWMMVHPVWCEDRA